MSAYTRIPSVIPSTWEVEAKTLQGGCSHNTVKPSLIYSEPISKHKNGLERWLSHSECLLLFQRTAVQFPVPMLGSSLLVAPVLEDLMLSYCIHGHEYMYTCAHR